MMMGMRKAVGAVLVAAMLGAGLVVQNSTGAAAVIDCDTTIWNRDHRAYIKEVDGCSYIAIRHKYDPVWSSLNYWTGWSGGYGSYYVTLRTPYLYLKEGMAG